MLVALPVATRPTQASIAPLVNEVVCLITAAEPEGTAAAFQEFLEVSEHDAAALFDTSGDALHH